MGAEMTIQGGLLAVLGVADMTVVGLQAQVEPLVLGARPLLAAQCCQSKSESARILNFVQDPYLNPDQTIRIQI